MLRNWWRRPGVDPNAPLFEKLHSLRRFQAILDVERQRVDRAGGCFALVVFRFESGADTAFRLFAQFLQARVRTIDHAGLMGQRQVGVILWDTAEVGARHFVHSLARAGHTWTHPQCIIYAYPQTDIDSSPNTSDQEQSPETMLIDKISALGREIRESVGEREPTETDGEETPTPSPGETWSHSSTASADQRDSCVATAVPCTSERLRTRTKTITGAQPSQWSSVSIRPLAQLFAQPLPLWKRALDVLAAGFMLLVLLPLLVVTAVAIKWTSAGPVLFLQRRSGLGGQPFTIFKFRTMCINAETQKANLRAFSEQDGPAFKMTHDPRVTWLGRYLRKSCIDELPQLWNVLVGDMTLVGPRPLPCDEQAGCTTWQSRRLEVTPGLTCFWQVHGKSRVSFAEWMRMDIRYIQARTLLQDLRLICETVWAVILHRGSC